MKEKIINIANDFTKFPSGRYKTDGKFSGEHFRDEHLLPKLKENDRVVVNINNVRGYGSSFLEEAFGGIVRGKLFTASQLKERLVIKCDDNYRTYKTEIWQYINEAQDGME